MNATEPTTGTVPRWRVAAATLMAWLAGRQRGRWATCRGRWIKTLLTAALLVTGLSAWAVALVQPWTGRAPNWDVMTLTSTVDAARVRAASAEVLKLVPAYVPPTPKPLRRNLFEGARPASALPPAPPAAGAAAGVQGLPGEGGVPTVCPPVGGPPLRGHVSGEWSSMPSERRAGHAAVDDQAVPVPPPQVLAVVKGLKLEIILITPEGERWAVINGASYREGDAVAGLEVVEIREGHVTLQQGGLTCLLRMD